MADNQETADIKIQYYVSKDKNPKKKKKSINLNATHTTMHHIILYSRQ